MTDKTTPDHELLERVFKTEPEATLDRLPDSTETRSARRHIDLAYKYAKESREKVKQTPTSSITVETRGPAVPGWPWAQNGATLQRWCWTCPADPQTGAGHWHVEASGPDHFDPDTTAMK